METINEIQYLKTKAQLNKKPRKTIGLPFYMPVIRFAFSVLGTLFPKMAAQVVFKSLNLPSKCQGAFRTIIEGILKKKIEEVDVSLLENEIQTKKILLVHDEKDRIVPISESKKVYDQRNNVQFLISEDLGHYQVLKNPELVQKVVAFMDA